MEFGGGGKGCRTPGKMIEGAGDDGPDAGEDAEGGCADSIRRRAFLQIVFADDLFNLFLGCEVLLLGPHFWVMKR